MTSHPPGCVPGGQPAFDSSQTAAEIAAEMAARDHLVTTSPEPASTCGLSGVTLDVRLAVDAPPECFPVPAGMLVHGEPPSEGSDQAIGSGTAIRFYFFDRGADVLMIEIPDVSGGEEAAEVQGGRLVKVTANDDMSVMLTALATKVATTALDEVDAYCGATR